MCKKGKEMGKKDGLFTSFWIFHRISQSSSHTFWRQICYDEMEGNQRCSNSFFNNDNYKIYGIRKSLAIEIGIANI